MLFTLFSVCSSVSGNAQDLVRKQLLEIGVNQALKGYSLTHDVTYASLYDDGSDSYFFTLRGGTSYKIFAVCDGDCSDIDLKLYDENGNEVDKDILFDDKPLVTVSPKWTGRFKLRVTMAVCNIQPCKFGIGVFGN